ncbi:MAG: ester cyclase [Pseudomonadota bacterium]
MNASERFIRNKISLHRRLVALAAAGGAELSGSTDAVYAADALVHAYHPVNELRGREAVANELWQPLLTALPDAERRDNIVIAGEYEGSDVVALLGHIQGNFEKPLHGIPPTHGVVHLRYGEVHHLQDGLIRESWVIADMLNLMDQAGCRPVAPSLGAEHLWPAPATNDGVQTDRVDAEAGAATLRLVKRMHGGLLKFDGRDIESMDHEKYWKQDFLWYGPSGIGTSRGLDGFRAHHQIPFLRAFPDRKTAHHFAETGDGDYVVTGGWPSVTATHTGPDWLGLPPTGKHVDMRVMDFYRCEDGLVAENWVPIDIIDMLRQFGVDVFERMRHFAGRPRTSL